MGKKWLWGSCLLLLTSLLLIGWGLPVEKKLHALFQFSMDDMREKEVEAKPRSKQPPVLKGQIQRINGNRIMVVENHSGEVKGYVTITKETKIFQKVNAKYVEVKQENLQVGMNISVWQNGPILMIYPAQLTADEVVIENKNGK